MLPSKRPWITMSSSPEISPTNRARAPITVAGDADGGVSGAGGGAAEPSVFPKMAIPLPESA